MLPISLTWLARMHRFVPEERFMRLALEEAQDAFDEGEVPIGAVIVCQGQVIARAHNQVERLHDPTAHAEILAITAATDYLGGKFLSDCQLYVTIEPCVMCAGALFHARLGAIIYGAGGEIWLSALCSRALPSQNPHRWRSIRRRSDAADA